MMRWRWRRRLARRFSAIVEDAVLVADQTTSGDSIDLDAVARITAEVNGTPELAPAIASQLRALLSAAAQSRGSEIDRLLREEGTIGPP